MSNSYVFSSIFLKALRNVRIYIELEYETKLYFVNEDT
jgi:hypothetical protein